MSHFALEQLLVIWESGGGEVAAINWENIESCQGEKEREIGRRISGNRQRITNDNRYIETKLAIAT